MFAGRADRRRYAHRRASTVRKMANRDSPGFRLNRRSMSRSTAKRGCPDVDAQYRAKLQLLKASSARPNWRWPDCAPLNRRHAKLRYEMAVMLSNSFDPAYGLRILPLLHVFISCASLVRHDRFA